MMKVLIGCFFMLVFSFFGSGGAITLSGVCFFSCLFMMFKYSLSLGGEYLIFMSGFFGYDSCSFLMVLLTFWVVGLMFLTLIEDKMVDQLKVIMFIFMLIVLLLFFSVYNFLLFYFFFEISLIPTFMVVYMWGKSLERMEAAFFLLLYMMFISFPLLVLIFKMGQVNCSLDLNVSVLFSNNVYSGLISGWDFLILFMAFFIKLPVYLFHIWLPKAHVEAPVYGSMILAAVLLKLGGYGLIRLIFIFIDYASGVSDLIISLGLVGSLYMSVLCLIQSDMKSLVAYSSVVHMNFMMSSLFVMVKSGLISGLIMMISHGLCSSGLFYMVNVFYKYSFSRLVILNKGYIEVAPSLSILWFFLCVSNFSFPFSLNFLGEIIVFMVLLSWGSVVMVIMSLVAFFSGAYSLYLFSMVLHGPFECATKDEIGLLVDYMMILFHYIPLLILLFNVNMFCL